jgi:hypothetical protein
MAANDTKPIRSGFVILHLLPDGCWEILDEVPRQPGLTARAARTRAVLEASHGAARPGKNYAAVPLSEWRVARDWGPTHN